MMSLSDDKQADIIDTYNTIHPGIWMEFKHNLYFNNMVQCMRFPTMWCVRPAKPQINLRTRAV